MMNQHDRARLIRYGAACGGLFLLALLAWLLLWRIGGIQTALAEMRQVADPMARQQAYYWLGQVFSGSAAALAGAAALGGLILEGPVLKAGPLSDRRQQGRKKENHSWLASFAGLLAVQALLFKSGGLASALYITPILFFAMSAVWLAYRMWCWHGAFCRSEPA